MIGEYHNWQVVVPRLALRHEYLLHGLLAMAALELASDAQDDFKLRQQYVEAAVEYNNLASSRFRDELLNLSAENHRAMFALASIFMVMGLALPQFTARPCERVRMLEHVFTFLELAKGFVAVALSDKDVLQDPLLVNYPHWDQLPENALSSEVAAALDRLTVINDVEYGTNSQGASGVDALQKISYHAALRRAGFFLREHFSKCTEPDHRGYTVAWPLQAGDDYLAAVKAHEPVALIMLMHWGVLLDYVARNPYVWWADSVGKNLVDDVSHIIAHDVNEAMRSAVQWARQQVGLDADLSAYQHERPTRAAP
ncbi:hypothetical protein ES702_02661 [subsurface metagenome]